MAIYIFGDKIGDAVVGGLAEGVKQGINDSDLRDQDKQVINEQVDRVTKAYQDGDISNEQFVEILENLAESPVLFVAMVYAIDQQYIAKSGLSAEEKVEGRRTLERVARGLHDKSMTESDLDQAMPYIATRQADGNWQLKEQVSDEELRAFLAECKQKADAAGVPDEPFEVDIGAEVKKAVDQVMGE